MASCAGAASTATSTIWPRAFGLWVAVLAVLVAGVLVWKRGVRVGVSPGAYAGDGVGGLIGLILITELLVTS